MLLNDNKLCIFLATFILTRYCASCLSFSSFKNRSKIDTKFLDDCVNNANEKKKLEVIAPNRETEKQSIVIWISNASTVTLHSQTPFIFVVTYFYFQFFRNLNIDFPALTLNTIFMPLYKYQHTNSYKKRFQLTIFACIRRVTSFDIIKGCHLDDPILYLDLCCISPALKTCNSRQT